MARGRKTGGRDFKKGQSGNPGGKTALPEDLRQALNLSFDEFRRTIIEVRNMSLNDVKKIEKMNLPLGKRAIIGAYRKMNFSAIKMFEDRLWGKAVESNRLLNIDGDDVSPTLIISDRFLPNFEGLRHD